MPRNADSLWRLVKPLLHDFYQQAKQRYGDMHFWTQELQSLLASCEQRVFDATGKRGPAFILRDQQMARNLQWLATYKYPHQKIIVWAANDHVVRRHKNKTGPYPITVRRMGGFFTQTPAWSQATYVLGFTSLQGKAGRIGGLHFNIPPPKKNSFETWIQAKGTDNVFVDFKAFKEAQKRYHKKFYMKANVYYENIRADWTHAFDGVFYIKEMYPCKR